VADPAPSAETDPDEPDDHDEVPARTAASTNVDEVMRLLAWGRANKFAFPSLRIGDVVVVAEDLRGQRGATTVTRDRSIWAENGVSDKDLEE
jgi:hypothetical protein